MQDIPINLGGYRLMVTEEPAVKMRENRAGELEPVVNKAGEMQYVVTLFAKTRLVAGQRPSKGEEIRVNLPGPPSDECPEGSYVELVGAVINTYEMRGDNGQITASGVWFKAQGVKSVARPVASAA